MSMSTCVVGYREADDLWRKMVAILEACDAAGVDSPPEATAFFGDEGDPKGPGAEVPIEGAVTDFSDSYRQGFDVDVTKLPPGVKIVRFYNSW